MADHADENFDGDIFIYRGGRAPQHVTHARIDKSVNEIEENAFENCRRLVQVDTHDGIRKIGKEAFYRCESLRRISLESAVEIEDWAFFHCVNLADVEFGVRLETIGEYAFSSCSSLQLLKLPSIVTIGSAAFFQCFAVTDIELSERLETIGEGAFHFCNHLQRIAIPLKRDLFEYDDDEDGYSQFYNCSQLTTVDLVGGIHKTVASLHKESWRVDMLAEINRINQVLPNTRTKEKTEEIREWMESVMDKMYHYKAAHCMYVNEGITFLELALWKAKLCEKEVRSVEGQKKKAKVDGESTRKERRVTCGADVVIKNVLPFLQLE